MIPVGVCCQYLFIYLFICLFASDTCNLDHMHPYQLLVDVTKKKENRVLGGKCDIIVDNHYCVLNKVSFHSNKRLPCAK